MWMDYSSHKKKTILGKNINVWVYLGKNYAFLTMYYVVHLSITKKQT